MIKYLLAILAVAVLATAVAKEPEAVESRRKAVVLDKNKEAAQERKERKEARMSKLNSLR